MRSGTRRRSIMWRRKHRRSVGNVGSGGRREAIGFLFAAFLLVRLAACSAEALSNNGKDKCLYAWMAELLWDSEHEEQH